MRSKDDNIHQTTWEPIFYQPTGLSTELHYILTQEKATDQIRKLGADFCKVISAVHALTSCDNSSKAGTKAAALKAKPVVYQKGFGSVIPMFDFKAQAQNAFKKQNSYNWHKLRSWLYHHTKHTTLHSSPLSKGALLAHIFRSFYISY